MNMNEKITLPALTTLLSRATGDSKKQSEDFIREFFSLISTVLQNGESVKIKNIGVFKLIEVEARKSVNVTNGAANEIPAHRKVVFIPSKELAADVNEPFEMFETVELAGPIEASMDIVIPEPEVVTVPEETIAEEEEIDEAIIAAEAQSGDVTIDVQEAIDTHEDVDVHGDTEKAEPDTACADSKEVCEEQEDTDSQEEYVLEEPEAVEEEKTESIQLEHADSGSKPHHRNGTARFWWGALCGFVAACLVGVVAMLVIFPGYYSKDESEKPEAELAAASNPATQPAAGTPSVMTEDSVAVNQPAAEESEDEVAPTKPSDEKVYDTITKTRYLTTMAQDHYGNFNFWPYIYKENQSILGHPDRIRPGTKVVVPNLSKYGVSVDNPKDIATAKRLGVEIYSRYTSRK